MPTENKTPEELEAQRIESEKTVKAEADAKEAAEKEKEKSKLLEKPDELYKELQETRSEAKERRLEAKALKDKIAEYEKRDEDAKQKDMKAKGKHEEIIAELNKKLNELENEKTVAEKWRQYESAKKEKIKKSLEEKKLWMESFAKLDLSELEALDEKFKTADKSPTDTSRNFTSKNGKDEREPWEKMVGNYKS